MTGLSIGVMGGDDPTGNLAEDERTKNHRQGCPREQPLTTTLRHIAHRTKLKFQVKEVSKNGQGN